MFAGWLEWGEILRVAQRVSKKKEVEVSRQGRNCHSERREESLWRRTCLEPKIHACDYTIAALLILRFAQNDNTFFILHDSHYTFWTPSQNDKGKIGVGFIDLVRSKRADPYSRPYGAFRSRSIESCYVDLMRSGRVAYLSFLC